MSCAIDLAIVEPSCIHSDVVTCLAAVLNVRVLPCAGAAAFRDTLAGSGPRRSLLDVGV